MKTFYTLLLGFVSSISAIAQNTDLPGPIANLQTLAIGTYVIPMDNTYQTNTAGDFNLKAYGLVVYLLNNSVKVKWAIKAGKSKDGTDFTATTEKFQPTLVSGGVSRNFKGGPFIIEAADTSGVAAFITAYYTARSLTGNNRPAVYRLTVAATNVDIRYNLGGFTPKAQILDDGGNEAIHIAFMTNCGVTTSNYTTGPATDLYTKCYTFASEPHNGTEDAAAISAIKSFVQNGGNFLAQCAAVETYENSSYGHFQTTNGFTVTNTNVNPASTIYPNPDLAYSQYEGVFDIDLTGSVKNWALAGGSSFKYNEHNHATGGTIVTQTPIGASVSKLTGGALPGGLVYYLGNHNFSSITAIASINGIRMYMNAFLTPVAINSNCVIGEDLPNPLPVKLISFTANLERNQSKVNLNWHTATEINTSHFVVERSTDGITFTDAGTVLASGSAVEKKYQHTDYINSLTAAVIYYRLRQVDIDGKAEYSGIRVVKIDKQPDNIIRIVTYPNPVTNEVYITIPENWENKKVAGEIVDVHGQIVKKIISIRQAEKIDVKSITPGLYIVKLSCEGQIAQQRIVKR